MGQGEKAADSARSESITQYVSRCLIATPSQPVKTPEEEEIKEGEEL